MKKAGCYLFALLLCSVCTIAVHAQTLRTDSPSEPVLTGFGGAVAVGDGAVFVGEPLNPYHSGVVYVYRPDASGAWTEQVQLTASDATTGDHFGQALAVTDNTLLVGATHQDSARGSVYVFQRDDASADWTQAARLAPEDGAAEDRFGGAVALQGDLALVGAPAQSDAAGAVYVYRRDPANGAWAEAARLTGSAAEAQARFGAALAVGDGQILIGAPGQNNAAGAAYVFTYDDAAGSWKEEAILTGSTAQAQDRFGSAIDLKNGMVLVGAPRHGSNVGAVFAFRRDVETGAWTEQARLVPFDGGPQHRFGGAIAFSGDEAWIGAPGANRFAGTVYRFQHDGQGHWVGARQLTPQERQTRDSFGGTVAARDDVAVVGITGADYGVGIAVIFEREGDGWTEQATLRSEAKGLEAVVGDQVRCDEGAAARFDCKQVDLVSFLPIQDIGGGRGVRLNDIWGWTDPETGKEYALVGRVDGTSFVDISDPANPVYIGDLPKTEGSPGSSWRDIKVYKDHAFIVSDNAGEHGMQVLDLTRLRTYDGEPILFEEDAHYDKIHSTHNIVINEETGFAYAVGNSGGGETCGGGLHMINIQEPKNPTFAGCFADPSTGRKGTGYTHDAQCVVYRGPDGEHEGQEICFGSNETALSIADVTDKENPKALAVAEYPNVSYTHQGWITDDHRYFFVNDELDELSGKVPETRTLIWDITDLDDPQLVKEYTFGTQSSDHNLYIQGNYMYQSNYASGLRIHDIRDVQNPTEVGYFDTSPAGDNSPGFSGTWSNYPFFKSGVIAVSSIGEGLFLLKQQKADI